MDTREKGYYPVSPFTPPHKTWNKESMHKFIESNGIAISRYQISEYFTETREDENHFKNSSGVLLTKTGPIMLYEATNGYFYLRKKNEFYTLASVIRELHQKDVYDAKKYPAIERAFVFITDKASFDAIVDNRKGVGLGASVYYTMMHIIPATKEGISHLNDMVDAYALKAKNIENLRQQDYISETL